MSWGNSARGDVKAHAEKLMFFIKSNFIFPPTNKTQDKGPFVLPAHTTDFTLSCILCLEASCVIALAEPLEHCALTHSANVCTVL